MWHFFVQKKSDPFKSNLNAFYNKLYNIFIKVKIVPKLNIQRFDPMSTYESYYKKIYKKKEFIQTLFFLFTRIYLKQLNYQPTVADHPEQEIIVYVRLLT